MILDIITLFPKMFSGPFSESMIKRACENKLVKINIHNLRDWAKDKHHAVDDRPFGGGAGMVLMCQPIFDCIEELKLKAKSSELKTIFLTPQGKTFDQQKAQELSKKEHFILLCGHYEGIDQRVRDTLIDEEISIGDYVLTGGELPAMVLADSIIRLIPGVVKEEDSIKNDSFSNEKKLLDYPQYTRPAEFKELKVPEVLLSGNHKEIEKWRKKKSIEITKKRRKDILHV